MSVSSLRHVTVALGIAAPYWSVISALRSCVSPRAAKVWLSGVSATVVGTGDTSAVNRAAIGPAVADSVCGLAVPSVHVVVASPSASVVDESGATVPSPSSTAKTTSMPETG